jgi:hypothetical protein
MRPVEIGLPRIKLDGLLEIHNCLPIFLQGVQDQSAKAEGARILRVEEHRLVQVLQRMIEVMLAYMEIPALAIGDSIPRIGAYPRILLTDLPIEIDVAVVALRRHVLPLPNHAVGAITRTWSASSSSASPANPEAQAVLDRGKLDHLDEVDRKDRQHLLLAGGYLSMAFRPHGTPSLSASFPKVGSWSITLEKPGGLSRALNVP